MAYIDRNPELLHGLGMRPEKQRENGKSKGSCIPSGIPLMDIVINSCEEQAVRTS